MNVIEVISAQRKGRCLVEAQEKLQELVQECQRTGKKGKFTLTLEVSAAEDSTVVLRDDITTKLPKPQTSSTVFYADDQGALYREDPRQSEFPEVARIEEAINQ